MALRSPSVEDQRKIHAEINQLNQQRFLISTLALTIFGALLAWMLPKQSTPTQIGPYEYSISTLLTWTIFGLFLLSYTLRKMLRVLSSYLVETGASGWETDAANFRNVFGYTGYTKPQAILFIVLNIVSVAFPFILSLIFSVPMAGGFGFHLCWISGAITVSLTVAMGFFGVFEPDAKISYRWKHLNQTSSDVHN